MKRIYYIIAIILFVGSACSDIDYEFNEEYEKAEITGVDMYNREMKRAQKSVNIDPATGKIIVVLNDGENIKDLKLTTRISTGATINPVMSSGFQDFTSPKTYTVTSPRETIMKEWTISVE